MQQIPQMTATETLGALWQLAGEHLRMPAGYEWAPLAGSCACALFGAVLLLRGARWAPGLAGLLLGGLCGVGAAAVAQNNGYSPLPAGLVVGVLGLGACLLMFRVLQAALLAGCLALAGVGVYYARALTPEVQSWLSRGIEGETLTLRPAGQIVDAGNWAGRAGELWNHLAANVPQFQLTLGSVVGLTLAAGFVFGLLLPRLSRAIWASTLGTLICGVGATGLLQQFAPAALTWLAANPAPAWGVVAGVWFVSLVINLVSTRRARPAAALPPIEQSKPAAA